MKDYVLPPINLTALTSNPHISDTVKRLQDKKIKSKTTNQKTLETLVKSR